MKRPRLDAQLAAARRRIFDAINRRCDAELMRQPIRRYYPRYGARKEVKHEPV